MADIESAWQRNLDEFEEAGYTRTNVTEWERHFWEAGYQQGARESNNSQSAVVTNNEEGN
jgi:hypothetical protein